MPTYEFARPGLTVDLVVFYSELGAEKPEKILLIKRGNDPYKGCWALPGGYVEEGEKIEDAAVRELKEETSLTGIELAQMKTYGDPGRDPRGWTATVAFLGWVVGPAGLKMISEAKAGDDAKDLQWFSLRELPPLAFDHGTIIEDMFK